MAKILVVDDSSFHRKNIIKTLNLMGHQTLGAKNAYAGIEVIHEHLLDDQIDYIMYDLLMPEIDGFQFLKRIALEKIEIPIIILVTDDHEDAQEKALALGASSILRKPPKEHDVYCALLSTQEEWKTKLKIGA